MAQSHIEWTEMTWNPTTGCDKLSAGYKFCYAVVMAKRLQAMGIDKYKQGFKLALQPIRRKQAEFFREEHGMKCHLPTQKKCQ